MEPTTSAAPAGTPPDPPQDHPAWTLPDNIAVILHAVGVLLGYGRHMLDTVCDRAAAPNFNAIAACFGTANLSRILFHLNRGFLRAIALDRFLRDQAAKGRDVDFVERRTHAPQPAPAATEPEQQATRREPKPSRPAGWDDAELFMPTLEDLERQVRRQPIGRTLLAICQDLAVVPGLCTIPFWNELHEIMHYYGGSVATLMQQKTDRREAFAKEQDRVRDSNWDWLTMTRDALRQVLGFFIGEPPVNPFDPDAATATGPP